MTVVRFWKDKIMKKDLKNIPCFGVAGNFTGHLEQAGEAVDFANVKAAAGAPKAIFPTYLPGGNLTKGTGINVGKNVTPEFLKHFPFDSAKIIYPSGEQKVQLEPECAVFCKVEWKDGKVVSLTPTAFAASNDCSIRKEGAKKISLKKNWGESSKGLSEQIIPVDEFSKNGILNKYRIASFLVRDGKAFQYGEDSAVRDYSYIYHQLVSWMIDKFNNQIDEGPAENLNAYLNEAGCPEEFLVSIGATRYTDFGEHNFLQNDDESVVVLYPEDKYNLSNITEMVENHDFSNGDVSILCQKVCL